MPPKEKSTLSENWTILLREMKEKKDVMERPHEVQKISLMIRNIADMEQKADKILQNPMLVFPMLIEDVKSFRGIIERFELKMEDQFKIMRTNSKQEQSLAENLKTILVLLHGSILTSITAECWINGKVIEFEELHGLMKSCPFARPLSLRLAEGGLEAVIERTLILTLNNEVFRDPLIAELVFVGKMDSETPQEAVREVSWFQNRELRSKLIDAFEQLCYIYKENRCDNLYFGIQSVTSLPDLKKIAHFELICDGKGEKLTIPTNPKNLRISRLPWPTLSWIATNCQSVTGHRFAYRITSKGLREQPWIEKDILSTASCSELNNLKLGEQYEFKVQLHCSGVRMPFSESYKTRLFSAQKLKKHAKVLDMSSAGLAICQPDMAVIFQDKLSRVRKIEIGKRPAVLGKPCSLLVMGETGAGKSAWINSLVNMFFEVDYPDGFRFKIITDEDNASSPSKSKTPWITIYNIYSSSKRVGECLTVIDTPGFGDTEGIECDLEITEQVSNFLLNPDLLNLESLTKIAIIVKCSDGRVGAGQFYALNKVLTIFGNNFADHIIWIVNFSDAKRTPAVEAIERGQWKSKIWLPFTNSMLFANPNLGRNDLYGRAMWQFNYSSFQGLFKALKKAHECSLNLTRSVVYEREQLAAALQGLKQQIRNGFSQLCEFQLLLTDLACNRQDLENNHLTQLSTTILEDRLVSLQDDQKAVLCKVCMVNCHVPCTDFAVRMNWSKRFCSVIQWNGACSVCPNNCSWKEHEVESKSFQRIARRVNLTLPEIFSQYHIDWNVGDRFSSLLKAIKVSEAETNNKVEKLIRRAHCCIQRLKKIALKPGVPDIGYYIEEFIAEDTNLLVGGCEARLKIIQRAKLFVDKLMEESFEFVSGMVDDEPKLANLHTVPSTE